MKIFELRLEQDDRYSPLGMFSSIEKAIEYAKAVNLSEYQEQYDDADFTIVQWGLDKPREGYSTAAELSKEWILNEEGEPTARLNYSYGTCLVPTTT